MGFLKNNQLIKIGFSFQNIDLASLGSSPETLKLYKLNTRYHRDEKRERELLKTSQVELKVTERQTVRCS